METDRFGPRIEEGQDPFFQPRPSCHEIRINRAEGDLFCSMDSGFRDPEHWMLLSCLLSMTSTFWISKRRLIELGRSTRLEIVSRGFTVRPFGRRDSV